MFVRKTIWKVCLFGNIWIKVPTFLGDLLFMSNFVRICDESHIIGRNLKVVNIEDHKYLMFEKEKILIDECQCSSK